MSDNGDKPHEGPHGPGCHCDKEEVTAKAMAAVLSDLLPGLMKAWMAGEPGMTIDFRFDKGKEHYGIAVRGKVLEDDGEPWPIPDVDTMAKMVGESGERFLRWSASDTPPESGDGKETLH